MATAEFCKLIDDLPENEASFFHGYVQAMGFTGRTVGDPDASNDKPAFSGSGDFDSNWNVWDEIKDHIDNDDVRQIIEDVKSFCESAGELIDSDELMSGNFEQAGTDFHFTRNGHGAGFWDGDWSNGDKLTELSKPYGSKELEVYRDEENDDEILSVGFCY